MLIERSKACDYLKISRWSSYRGYNRLRPRMHMVAVEDVVDMLNRAARAGQPKVHSIPCDVQDAEGVSARTGLPSKWIVRHTRSANPIPHWHINDRVIRFSMDSVMRWINEGTK